MSLPTARLYTRLEDCPSVEAYVNEIIQTAYKLNCIDMKVFDEWVGAILLAGLPDHYKPMIMGIESSGIKVTADAMKTKLLQDICVQKSKKRSALFGYGNKNSSDLGTNRSRERKYVIADSYKGTGKRPRCYKCNRYSGHIAKNCDENSSKKQVFVQKSDKSEFTMFTSLSAHVKSTGNDWFLDSGCSAHLTVDKSNFISEETSSKLTITTANDQQMETNCVGDIQLPVRVTDQSFNVNVENVFYVPDLKVNLTSVSQIVPKGNKVNFDSEGARIINDQGKIIATATLQNNLFKIDRPSKNAMLTRSDTLGNALLWHKRHVNFPNLNKLKNGLVHGIKCHEKIPEGFVCEICTTSKSHRLYFSESTTKTSRLLQTEDFSYKESDDSSGEEPPNLEEDQSGPDFILSRQTTSLPEQHLRRGDRIRRPPQTHDDYVSYSCFVENFSNPTSVEEVLASPDKLAQCDGS
ncbi:hypothetical protein JTB14_015999 [Gonioctena quinquepunctata]|nr:hypothetical protein JTB14_015999 [Gonioctena quinquepunctata]